MPTVYVRKPGSRPIHIQRPDDFSTRCFPGRYKTQDWETVEMTDRDWQHLCQNCLKTPEAAGADVFYQGKEEAWKEEKVLRETGKKTRRL